MQAYRVYYDEGKFIPFEPVEIKKGSQAIVTILDFPFENTNKQNSLNDASSRQIEAMRRFREEIRDNDEPVPEFERVTLRDVEI